MCARNMRTEIYYICNNNTQKYTHRPDNLIHIMRVHVHDYADILFIIYAKAERA